MGRLLVAVLSILCVSTSVYAEVVSSSSTHYVLRHEARSALDPAALWARLIEPSSWWQADHTWSGDAANLSLDAEAGGYWREDWDSGSVVHGRILMLQTNKTLRMEAPFGPLQGVGAYVVWTISISADGDGSVVVFDETALAPPAARLDQLAPAVDGVKSEAMSRLTAD